MSIKKTILAAAIAAFAFTALPALAAAQPSVDFTGSTHFTVAGGAAKLTSDNDSITCTSSTGTGEFTNGETGTIELTFHGCKDELGFNCTSSGQPKGTITTTSLQFHLVTITNGKDGILITSNQNHFASFSCFVVGVVVSGNGIIGEITSPATNETSPSFGVKFTGATATKQADTTIDGSSTEYGLEASIGGEPAEPVSQDGEGTGTFTTGGEGKLT